MDWVKRSLFVHVGLSLGVGALAPLGCDADDDGSPPRRAEQPNSEDLEADGPAAGEDAEGHPCDNEFDERTCDQGRQFCAVFDAGLEWGPCLTEAEIECEPGSEETCSYPDDGSLGTIVCRLPNGVPWEHDPCWTPLVLAFDDTPVEFSAAGSATFDLVGDGACITHDWPTPRTPWLAIDLDRNGNIDGGHELFGSGTRMTDGTLAKNGFAALSELDENRDGFITAADASYNQLVLWSDHDRDRAATFWELKTLESRGVMRIDLAAEDRPACDQRGNCARDRSVATMSTDSPQRTASVIDVYLSCQ